MLYFYNFIGLKLGFYLLILAIMITETTPIGKKIWKLMQGSKEPK